jgi:hypothetical protein
MTAALCFSKMVKSHRLTEIFISRNTSSSIRQQFHGLFAPAEEPIATADLVPYEEFLKTRFYQEWARPQGLIDFISITLEKSATKSAMFGVFRHERQGSIDDETRRRMRLLGPHMKRAVLISKVVDF